jgi:hypothetical protein
MLLSKVPIIVSNIVSSYTKVTFMDVHMLNKSHIFLNVDKNLIQRVFVPKIYSNSYGFIVFYINSTKIDIIPITECLIKQMFTTTILNKMSKCQSKQKYTTYTNMFRKQSRLSICTF